jgi:hypothetical protein
MKKTLWFALCLALALIVGMLGLTLLKEHQRLEQMKRIKGVLDGRAQFSSLVVGASTRNVIVIRGTLGSEQDLQELKRSVAQIQDSGVLFHVTVSTNRPH